MCTSPLVRYRLKYEPERTLISKIFYIKSEVFDTRSKGFRIISKKKLESLFGFHSQYLAFMNAYCDYTEIPCGKCEECRRAYARDWSVRCYHESLTSGRSCFVTLTIDSLANKKFMEEIEKSYKKGTNRYCKHCQNGNKHFKFPVDYSLNKVFILDWLKRFRDYLYRQYKISIRYFGCGEYGSKNDRPHYHILLFGYDFKPVRRLDGTVFNTYNAQISKKGVQMKVSEELRHLWPYGFSYVEDLNFYACMYVAKYCMKKIKFFDSEKLFDYYYGRVPEFLFMSKGNCQVNRCKFIDKIIADKNIVNLRDIKNPYCVNCDKTRGGIGFEWFRRYFTKDIKKLGYIVIDNKKYPIPEYYKDLIKLTDLEYYDKLNADTIYYVNTRLETQPDVNSTKNNETRRKINRRKSSIYDTRNIE